MIIVFLSQICLIKRIKGKDMTDDLKYSEVKQASNLTELEKMGAAKGKKISSIAADAIKEAAQRRKIADEAAKLPKEFNGRKGPEPTRYSDWENKGITSDF